MSCACGTPAKVSGCNNNGLCATGACNKMNTFDWLSDMEVPVKERFPIVEVRFKGGRKDYYHHGGVTGLTTGDAVVVEAQNGHHIGYVSLQGELVRLQLLKKNISDTSGLRKIYRMAQPRDLEKFEEARAREMPTLHRTRAILRDMKLGMKLADVEYQADNGKATFYYTSENRVDFRELIKVLALEFKIKVEMRQVSMRQEAGRLGGIGVCGRELCCSTWLSEFRNVATSAARYQNLSLNPAKLSGQCGRLKCCLNYELDTYMEALKDIPKLEGPLLTEKGNAVLQKTDIFRKIMWFGFAEENTWYPVNINRVNEILRLNKEGRKPATLDENVVASKADSGPINTDLARLDQKYQGRNKRRKKRRKKGRGRPGGNSKPGSSS
jgi:cell fate regulator YaaT (PSP1 superfamily)